MSHPAFELKRSKVISSLKIECHEFEHIATGARHFHLASDDSNNAFLVAFQTIPEDSSGVAHILEHTSLCGSKKYPVRDPFFMMTRRSLNTFMNAFTASDWTAYPFATQSKKDFDNLLQVYLDATFFPNLNELDFLQEGHRVEFEQADDPTSDLVYKGVVFNEMKGAMSSPVQRIWQDMQSTLFSSNTFHFNSGGEPADIPSLSHQQLLDFHAKFYHPSNACFMTYGNFSVEAHQIRFEELVLDKFERQDFDLTIPTEERKQAPVSITTRYALDTQGDDNADAKSQVVMGWLLGSTNDLDATMDAQLLSGALLDNSASVLRHALETTDLGTAPSDLCGFDESMTDGVFLCGLEGCKASDTDKIQTLILSVIEKVAEQGVPQSELESILHQLELSQREVGGGHFPYGLQLMVKALTPTLHGADTFAALDMDPVLERLHRKIKDPDYIPSLAQTLLLENNHRILLTANPDDKLVEEQNQQEQSKLKKMQQELSDSEKAHIIDLTRKLKARQEMLDDPELLPSVSVEDAADDLNIPQAQALKINDQKISYYPTASNGIVYQHLVVRLPHMADELIEALPLFCECLNEVGIKDLDYLQTQQLQAAVSGGIRASLSYQSTTDDLQTLNAYFVLSGKALTRNQQVFSELLKNTFDSAKFTELDRLRELIAQIRSYQESGITQAGHRLAMLAASAGTSPYAQTTHHWEGLEGIRRIIALDDSLKDNKALHDLADKFRQIQSLLIKAPKQFLLINENKSLPEVEQSLSSLWQQANAAETSDTLTIPFMANRIRQAWTTSTQVNFCAKSYLTVPSGHDDSAALVVLGNVLRNGFLHRTIREQGGAYGGGASYMADTGTFRFYSYRDPRLADTLADFDKSLEWLQSTQLDKQQLEEAILGVISEIDRPDSPVGEARLAWYANLHGRTPERRRAFRKKVMQVTLDDLKRVAKSWLRSEQAHTAVITDTATLAEYNKANPDFQLEACPLKG